MRTKEGITSVVNSLYNIALKNWTTSLGYEALVKGGIALGIAHEEETTIKNLQEELTKLRAALDESIKVIEFYGQWCRDDLHCELICAEPTDKCAREFLSKHKELIKGEV